MKWSIIKRSAALLAVVAVCTAIPSVAAGMPADSVGARPDTIGCPLSSLPSRTGLSQRWRRVRPRMVPRQFTFQYAGSIGAGSLGVGWHYGRRDQWETDLSLGFLPRFSADRMRVVLAAKERFVPWHLGVGRGWQVEPLTAGLFVSSICGPGFWVGEPSRYGGSYYRFSSRLRANLFLGQRVGLALPPSRRGRSHALSAYYELSSCDLYIISAVPNRRIRLADILSLAVGVRYVLF